MKLSLKSKLILGGVVAAMLPLAIVGYFAVNQSTTALVANAEFQSSQIAKDLAMLAEEIVSQEMIYAESMAQAPVITQAVSKVYDSDIVSADLQIQALQKFIVQVYNKSRAIACKIGMIFDFNKFKWLKNQESLKTEITFYNPLNLL